MSLTPSNLRLKIILFLIFVIVLLGTVYFKHEEAVAPVIMNTTVDETFNAPKGQMEDGVLEIGEDTKATTTVDATTTPEVATSTSKVVKGSYSSYEESKIKKADEITKVVLFFDASWDLDSQKYNKEISSTKIPNNLIILSVDYDLYPTLKKKYDISSPNTFIEVDAEGNVIKTWAKPLIQDVFKIVK